MPLQDAQLALGVAGYADTTVDSASVQLVVMKVDLYGKAVLMTPDV